MIIATIGEFLAGTFQVIFEEPGITNSYVIRDIGMADASSTWFKKHCIYLVRDEQTTFYVGQSQKNILQRVGNHLGLNSFNLSSTLHRFFQANVPLSLNWYILFFTFDDCLKDLTIGGTGENQGLARSPRARWDDSIYTVHRLEQRMIQQYRPCLNIAHNLSPSSIPEHYRIPHSEIPDGIMCTFEGPRYEFIVSYQAYDYAHQENKTYTMRMYARYAKECRNVVIQLLGFEPDFLSVRQVEEMRDSLS